MSHRRIFAITCDHPGCTEEYLGRGDDSPTRLRGDAQGDHWGERLDGAVWLDLCPDHKETGR